MIVIIWDIANSLLRLAIAGIVIWTLLLFNDRLNASERFGLGFAGGCSVLTITVIWEAERSPFDGWATSLFSFGVLLYLVGRSWRHWQHTHNNRTMIEDAKRRLRR